MEPYEEAVGNDSQLVVDLYKWNIQIAGAFLEDLGVVEVLLRNALDRELRQEYQRTEDSQPWYEQNGILFGQHHPLVDEAIDQARRYHGVVQPEQDEVVAELSFGFWKTLLGQGYQSRLWPVLKRAFPNTGPSNPPKRYDVEGRVADLHDLRNDIAHHKPIFHWNFDRSFQNLKTVTGLICPEIQIWLVGRSRVPDVLDLNPLSQSRL